MTAEECWQSIMDSYEKLGYGLIHAQFDITAIPIIAAYGAKLEARAEKAEAELEKLKSPVLKSEWQELQANLSTCKERVLGLEDLLREWLNTPFFETREAWQIWVSEYRPRVIQALSHDQLKARKSYNDC